MKNLLFYIIIISERNWWRQYLHVYINSFSNWELKPDPGIVSTLIFVLKTYLFLWNKNNQSSGGLFSVFYLSTLGLPARVDTFFTAQSRLLSINSHFALRLFKNYEQGFSQKQCFLVAVWWGLGAPADKSLLLVFLLYLALLKMLTKTG